MVISQIKPPNNKSRDRMRNNKRDAIKRKQQKDN